MSHERFHRAKSVFVAARSLSGPERDRYVAEACGEEDRLRHEVDALLRGHDLEEGALERLERSVGSDGGGAASRRIGPYRLRRRLGEGGMGEVYLAEQVTPIRRTVALKLIRGGFDSEQVVARFETERQALALMSHPAIAAVLDAGATEDGRPYFVMELVEGSPITVYCDRRRLGIEERLGLFVTVCRAVQHAHERGVIHRDIKPSNVLVEERDGQARPKLIDFGIAKATERPLTEHSLQTRTGQWIGTPGSMSPEQAEPGRTETDTRTDVYSLGVLLYELLTGGGPIDEDRLSAMGFEELRRVLREEDPEPPSRRIARQREGAEAVAQRCGLRASDLRKRLAGDLDRIVERALAREPVRRYSSPAELADDVERHLARQPILARSPTLGYRLRRAAVRRRQPLLLGSLTGAALALGVVGASLLEPGTRRGETVGASSKRSDELAQEGRALIRERSPAALGDAISRLREAIELDPRSAAPRADLAHALLDLARRGDLPMDAAEQEAAALLARGLALDPREARVHAALGRLRATIGDLGGARYALERALELDGQLADAHLWLGNVLAALNERESAIAAFERALTLQPLSLEAHDALAGALMDQGRYAEGLAQYRLRLRVEPDSAETYRVLALWARTFGHLDDAVRWAHHAVELGPEGPLNWHELAMASSTLGDFAQANAAVEQALELAPNNHWTMFLRGFLAIEQGDFAALERFSQERLRESPPGVAGAGEISQDRRVRLALAGISKVYLGQHEEALELLGPALAAPGGVIEIGIDADLWAYLALAHRRVGRLADSDLAIERARELIGRRHDWIWAHLIMPETAAALFALEGDADRAVATLTRAVEDGWTGWSSLERSPHFAALRERTDFLLLSEELENRLDAARSRLAAGQSLTSGPR